MRALFLALSLSAAACASTEIEPDRVEAKQFVADDGSFSLELPVGWIRDGQALTRDGWDRQTITFNAGPVLDPESAGTIDPTAPEMLQAMESELGALPGNDVVECSAATFDGLPGFRMHIRRTETPSSEPGASAQTREVLICAAILGKTLFAFSFEAQPGDYERDLPTFERLMASFRCLLERPAS